MAVLNLEWTSQSADVLVTIEGGTMLYSNDASSANPIWQRLQPGVDICLARGTGPYILKEEVACTVTKCGFNDPTTASNLTGNMLVEDGTLETTNQMFHNCSGLTQLDVSKLNTALVTDMLSMFYNVKVPILDISNFDTNLVQDMRNMFKECSNLLTLDVSNFNTGNVTDMLGMFSGCSTLTSLDCSNFDTSKVTNMSAMFSNCTNIIDIDISNFDTSAVTIMTQMFSGCASLPGIDISSFDTNQVNAMTNMFWGCSSLTCISNLNTLGAVNGRGGIFTGCISMISPDATTRTALTTPTVGIGGANWVGIGVCPPPVEPLTINWDSQAGDTSVTIENADMEYTNDGGFNWTTLKPGDHKLPTGPGTYTLRELVNGSVSRCAFADMSCSSNFDGNMEAYGGAIRSADKMFFECNKLLTLDVTRLNTEYCSIASDMFSNCSKLTTLDVSTFDTSAFTNTSGMFNGCYGLTELLLSNFDTSLVQDLSSMFAGCSGLTTLDLSSFNTSAAVDTSFMFWGCSSLGVIDISTFEASVCLNTTQMFSQCCSITHLDLTSFDTQNVTDTKAMFYRSNLLVCITNLDTTAANNPAGRDSIFKGCDSLVEPDATNQADLTDGNGARWTNTNPCMTFPLAAPSIIVDFKGTETQVGQITFSWTNATGTPTPTYDLYDSTGLVQTNVGTPSGITSTYVLSITGAENYYVKAINSEGSADSNLDYGEGLTTIPAPIAIINFGATDTEINRIIFTWNDISTGPLTYNLYDSTGLVQAGIVSGQSIIKTGIESYYIIATNPSGTATSNTDNGTGLPVTTIRKIVNDSGAFVVNDASDYIATD